MAAFVIEDKDLAGLKGKVVIVTGGSSGIGLATVATLLSQGASVVNADLQAPAQQPEGAYTFVQANVAIWADLVVLFKTTKEIYGRVDHVFANAGVGPRTDYLATEVDENGDLKEPSHQLLDVSLKGVINTATLAIHYMRDQPEGGSIVINGSSTGLQRLRAVDYATAKHAVLGFGRGLVPLLDAAKVPIRVNTLAPTWTDSSVLPNLKAMMESIGIVVQPASAVARAAAVLMADTSRNGHVIHVQDGKYQEIDEAVLLPAFVSIKGPDFPSEDDVLRRLTEARLAAEAKAAKAEA
ncbi:short-chain dehydrogenase [Ilyonectria sp. MPI-CAGE-AT-0026]|nr:short-chain dehydrogenase [Ilyonectria sp. MPI-CAGE-AT-0026]